jgi:hypothetical protein
MTITLLVFFGSTLLLIFLLGLIYCALIYDAFAPIKEEKPKEEKKKDSIDIIA